MILEYFPVCKSIDFISLCFQIVRPKNFDLLVETIDFQTFVKELYPILANNLWIRMISLLFQQKLNLKLNTYNLWIERYRKTFLHHIFELSGISCRCNFKTMSVFVDIWVLKCISSTWGGSYLSNLEGKQILQYRRSWVWILRWWTHITE